MNKNAIAYGQNLIKSKGNNIIRLYVDEVLL